MPYTRTSVKLLVAAFALPTASTAVAAQTCTQRASVDSSGGQGNDVSSRPSISFDGRNVAFESLASNLVPGDTNGVSDVFVHDLVSGATARVSVVSGGGQGNDGSGSASISPDGRYVAFNCVASNLVPGDTNSLADIFVHDLQSGSTTRVSVDSGGGEGNGSSKFPSISSDGRYVAFESDASNLVPGDTNGTWDVFVHDRVGGATARVSVASGGGEGNGGSYLPSISSDGRYVAFESDASILVPGDTNGLLDVFVHDRVSGATARVSVASGGGQADGNSVRPSISSDGRYVAFDSVASNLVPGDTNGWIDAFVHDRVSGATTRVSVASGGGQGNDGSSWVSISPDGRYVAFGSYASNLVPGDTNTAEDAFVHDRVSGATTRVSVASGGGQGNGHSFDPAVSSDGRYIAFWGYASNLVPGDTNGALDVFVHDSLCSVGTPYCFGDGSGTPCPCGNPGSNGAGCANSSSAGGLLASSGSASVSADDLTFDATQLRPNQPALLFVGLNAINGGSGVAFGDGLRCAGGSVVRLGVMTPDAAGSASWGPGLGASGGWAPGDVRRFQAWYRDPSGPCGSGFNLTNGVEVSFGA